MIEQRFKISDKVWVAQAGIVQKWIKCPVCYGKGKVTLILGNGEHVGVDCTCLDASQFHVGLIQTYNYEADVKEYTITGMEVSQHRIRYHSGYECSYTVLDDDVVFASREDAIAKAEILKAEHEVNEQLKLSQTKKDKLNKNWAWHVKYHKQCVERAEHDLEYHKMKLSIATTKVMLLNALK